MSYKVAAPDEYLAITGMGVGKRNLKITKSAWLFPFQRCMRFSVQPRDYAIDLQAMTKEKLQFLLPVIFTVGPDVNQRGANAKLVTQNGQSQVGGGEDDAHIANGGDGNNNAANDNDQQRVDMGDALMKFAMLLAGEQSDSKKGGREHVEAIVKGIIEGETRVLVSSMTMEEIFTEREEFKRRVVKNIQGELDQFGLKIYNSNVKELKDAPGSVYFESLSRKAHEGATNQAKIDVADARLKGTVGEAQLQGEQERKLAKIHADTAVQKTERDSERAEAEATLQKRQAAFEADVRRAKLQAERDIESRDEDLKRDIQVKHVAAETERLRAQDVVRATIAREAAQQQADAQAYQVEVTARADAATSRLHADADAYQTKVAAEAEVERTTRTADVEAYRTKIAAEAELEKTTRTADADAYRTKVVTEAEVEKMTRTADVEAYRTKVAAEAELEKTTRMADAASYKTGRDSEADAAAAVRRAEAALQERLKEAQGLEAMAGAYAKMAQAFGGPRGLIQYMMLEKGTYVEMAKANAAAVAGMQPKISVWTTGGAGSGEGQGNPGIETTRNLYQMLPPLMTTINEQTGITLPEWQFGKLNAGMAAIEEGKTNGIKQRTK